MKFNYKKNWIKLVFKRKFKATLSTKLLRALAFTKVK